MVLHRWIAISNVLSIARSIQTTKALHLHFLRSSTLRLLLNHRCKYRSQTRFRPVETHSCQDRTTEEAAMACKGEDGRDHKVRKEQSHGCKGEATHGDFAFNIVECRYPATNWKSPESVQYAEKHGLEYAMRQSFLGTANARFAVHGISCNHAWQSTSFVSSYEDKLRSTGSCFRHAKHGPVTIQDLRETRFTMAHASRRSPQPHAR